MLRTRVFATVSLWALLCALAPALSAQTTAQISGRATDPRPRYAGRPQYSLAGPPGCRVSVSELGRCRLGSVSIGLSDPGFVITEVGLGGGSTTGAEQS